MHVKNKRMQVVLRATAIAVALAMTAVPGVAQEEGTDDGAHDDDEQEAFCPSSQGYWRHNFWPVDSMALGEHEYDEYMLRTLLSWPPRGDHSLILASQLIAAELNVAAGHDANVSVAENFTAAQAIAWAHDVVGDNELPAKVRGNAGQEWTAAADVLDAFNNGAFTPGCFEEEEPEDDEDPESDDEGREGDEQEPE